MKKECSRGQSIVELAILLPILLGFGALIVDLSNYASLNHIVNHAAFQGAKYAVESNRPLSKPLANCSLHGSISNGCQKNSEICCTAIQRTQHLLTLSNIDPKRITVEGEWSDEEMDKNPEEGFSSTAIFFEVKATAKANFLFGGSKNLTSSSFVYAGKNKKRLNTRHDQTK